METGTRGAEGARRVAAEERKAPAAPKVEAE